MADHLNQFLAVAHGGLPKYLTEARIAQGLASLADVQAECAEPDWDGYGADAIAHGPVDRAAELLRAPPRGIAMPEILGEPDGGVGLEWSNSAGETFVLVVDRDLSLIFAGQFARGRRKRGVVHPDEPLAAKILEILYRHFRSAS